MGGSESKNITQGKFSVIKFEFEGSFGMSLMGDYHEHGGSFSLALYIISLQAHT